MLHAAVRFAGFLRMLRADPLVITTRGSTGLAHMLMGSVAEDVVRRAAYPVLGSGGNLCLLQKQSDSSLCPSRHTTRHETKI